MSGSVSGAGERMGSVSEPRLSELIAEVTPKLRELARMQKRLLALCQQIETTFRAGVADDWEDRYILDGVGKIETFANRPFDD